MHRNLFLALAFMVVLPSAFAQKTIVMYDVEPEVEKVLSLHQAAWKNIKKVDGYRIQIVALAGTNSRNNALNVQKDFTNIYPEIGCYLTFNEPNFIIRVGDFKTRLEAVKALQNIQLSFPGAFVVKEKINFTEL